MEPYIFILIEVLTCLIITFLLLLYYSRKNTNPVVLITAYFTWSLNFILIVLLHFDLSHNDEGLDKMKRIGYTIIYWCLFFCSWIFVPLMQEYENSGEFTKLEKLKSSIKENLKFYLIMIVICIILFIGALIRSNMSGSDIITKVTNYSFLIGDFIFFLFFSYGIVKYPKNLYKKINYYMRIKYIEWRVQKDYDKLLETNYDLVNLGSRLYNTINVSRNESFVSNNNNINTRKKSKNDILKNENEEEKDKENEPKKVIDYIDYINKEYEKLSKTSSKLGIEFDDKSKEESKPIKEVKDLINVNKKINKKKLRNLRLQCRIRRAYNNWVTLCSVLLFNKLKNSKNSDNVKINISNENKENLLEVANNNVEINLDDYLSNLEKEGFIPLKGIGTFKQIYYMIIRKIILYLLVGIFGLLAIAVVILQLFIAINVSFLKIVDDVYNNFILYIIIIFSILFLFSMSLYTLFKFKVSGYFNMYGHRQTDSVSLMYFSSNLCRISTAICVNFIQAYKLFVRNDNVSTAEKYFLDENKNDKVYIARYCPLAMILLALFFLFDIHIKIGNYCGFSFFGIENEEINEEIKEGHNYMRRLNKKMNGELAKFNNKEIFDD